MPEDHFGESVAARYDDSADEMFDDSEKHVSIWQKQVAD
jgi:hypothetical protein